MKKALVILVALLAVPAMAATISIDNSTALTAVVTVTTDAANLVGVALDVDVDAGTVTAVSVDTANFNIFPDAAYSEELGDGYTYGEGTPVCAKLVAGEIALPQSSFALCFANLNGADVAGADGAVSVQVTITVSEACNITVCENATRGGLVAVDGAALDADCASAAIPGGGCTCKGDVNGDAKISIADMSAIIAFLSPAYAGTTPPYTCTPVLAGDECKDVNADGKISIADMSAIIAFLSPAYAGTTPPYTFIGCMP